MKTIKNVDLLIQCITISPFISAHRKNYNTQHVMIRLLEEWRENLD